MLRPEVLHIVNEELETVKNDYFHRNHKGFTGNHPNLRIFMATTNEVVLAHLPCTVHRNGIIDASPGALPSS